LKRVIIFKVNNGGIMFSKQLNKKLDEYHLLRHPFYKSWNEGKLTREIIKDYAEQDEKATLKLWNTINTTENKFLFFQSSLLIVEVSTTIS